MWHQTARSGLSRGTVLVGVGQSREGVGVARHDVDSEPVGDQACPVRVSTSDSRFEASTGFIGFVSGEGVGPRQSGGAGARHEVNGLIGTGS